MNKKFLFKISSIILTLPVLLTTVGCQKNNKNDLPQVTETTTKIIAESDKSIDYYKDLLSTAEAKIEYTGTFKLNGHDFSMGDKFSTLADEFMLLEYYKDKKIPAHTQTTIYSDHWDEDTYILLFNPTDKPLPYYECIPSGLNVKVTNQTRLYDVIGEQVIAIPENYNFVESVFFVFGCPNDVSTTDKTINVAYYYRTPLDNGNYINGEIEFVFDNVLNTGNFYITFK